MESVAAAAASGAWRSTQFHCTGVGDRPRRDPAGVDGGVDLRTGGRSTAGTIPGRLRRPCTGPASDREWPRRSEEAEIGRSTGTETRLQPVELVLRRAATKGEFR